MEEMEQMRRDNLYAQAQYIVAIIDMDGHMVDKAFVPKELAIKPLGSNTPLSFHFYNEEKPYSELSSKDRRTVDYVYRHIFDIPYHKYWFGMLRPKATASLLEGLRKREETSLWDAWYVAYKGGHYEKDILNDLGIPSFNLEDIGCPKVEHIHPVRFYKNCGHHHRSSSKFHCPTVEVQLFEQWLRQEMENKQLKLKNDFFTMCNPMQLIEREDFVHLEES